VTEDEQPPTRPGSHRAPVSRGESLRRLWPPFAAVAVVVLVIVLLLVINGRPTPPAGPALQSPSPVVSEQAPPASPTLTPTPTASRRADAGRSRPRRSGHVVAPKVPVDVLNNSTITGLAHEVAAQVEAKGWPIDVIGNFEGRIPESTLYYAAGQHEVATLLAHAMPQIQRVLPRFSGLPGDGLTLVVTRDWPH
jgi:hypothetical protein